jgi:hypothetical protein
VLDWLTLELVPVFVTSSTPPLMSYRSVGTHVKQESNGLGAMSGASIDAGFWLEGHAFRGYVLRAILTNYGYKYSTQDAAGNTVDSLTHTERRFIGEFGSVSRFGAFTIAGGIGLGLELNKQERCYAFTNTGQPIRTSGCGGLELLTAPPQVGRVDVADPLYPIVFQVSISLGVTID